MKNKFLPSPPQLCFPVLSLGRLVSSSIRIYSPLWLRAGLCLASVRPYGLLRFSCRHMRGRALSTSSRTGLLVIMAAITCWRGLELLRLHCWPLAESLPASLFNGNQTINFVYFLSPRSGISIAVALRRCDDSRASSERLCRAPFAGGGVPPDRPAHPAFIFLAIGCAEAGGQGETRSGAPPLKNIFIN